MKFEDLPKDAQHQALSTLRDLITAGCRKETELELAGKVKEAFVAMYSEESENTKVFSAQISVMSAPAIDTEEAAQNIATAIRLTINAFQVRDQIKI